MTVHIPPVLLVLAAAVAAPLIGEATRRIGLSVVVLEILLGVAIGPQGLGWGDGAIDRLQFLSTIGMAFLFFVAGLEIDAVAIRRELRHVLVGWITMVALACGAALAMRAAGLVDAWQVVAIALATTGLGVLVPILRDAGVLQQPFGRYVMAVGALGEVGPILAISLVLTRAHTTPVQTGFTGIFIVAVVLIALAATRVKAPGFLNVLRRTLTQSSQLPVRLAVLLLGGLAALAESLGLDLALGTLAAGMIVGLATRGADVHVLHYKIDALAFGFFVPVFFIVSGMKLDVASLFAGGAGLALLGAFLVALILVRAPLMGLLSRALGARHSAALGLYSATTLSLIVAITSIAVSAGLMQPAEAAPLVGAGILTVILFPSAALRLTGQSRSPVSAAAIEERETL